MLPNADRIHTFRGTGPLLIGADWPRAVLLDAIREYGAELSGASTRDGPSHGADRQTRPTVYRNGGATMIAKYRGETVRILFIRGTKAKIVTGSGVRWAQLSELELTP